jgi:hypothetical protein
MSILTYKINSSITESSDKLFRVSLAPNGKTIEEVIASGENHDLKYIISNEIPGSFHLSIHYTNVYKINR